MGDVRPMHDSAILSNVKKWDEISIYRKDLPNCVCYLISFHCAGAVSSDHAKSGISQISGNHYPITFSFLANLPAVVVQNFFTDSRHPQIDQSTSTSPDIPTPGPCKEGASYC